MTSKEFNVWFDQNEKRRKRDLTRPTRISGVKGSAVYLLLLGKDTLTSDAVLAELRAALREDKPILVTFQPEFTFPIPNQGSLRNDQLRDDLNILLKAQDFIPFEGDVGPLLPMLRERYATRKKYSINALRHQILSADPEEESLSVVPVNPGATGQDTKPDEAIWWPQSFVDAYDGIRRFFSSQSETKTR